MGREEGAAFRCFYSSLTHDTWRVGWRESRGEGLRTERSVGGRDQRS